MKQKLANGTEMEVDIGALAENVLEDENHRFVTDAEKEAFLNASGGAGKAKYASDLREATGAAFYYWREDTVGNPYSAGLADCSCGFAVVYGDDQDGYTILASGQGPLDDHLYLGTSTGKTDDIQWTKVPMASDITNAINAKVKWTIYSRVTDIGLTVAACTIQTIDSALPSYSMIEFPAFKTDYKAFSFGGTGARHKLKIVKGVDGYSYAEDMDLTNNVMYIASKAASDAEWSQWRAIEGHEVVAASPVFDFNQCTFNGTRKYALSSSPISAALNKPATAPGILTSTKIGSYIVQDYLTTGGIRYTRSYNGSAWTDWQELNIAELKKSVADGKKLVADAVSGKGITTAADASFATMANNISKIYPRPHTNSNIFKTNINSKTVTIQTIKTLFDTSMDFFIGRCRVTLGSNDDAQQMYLMSTLGSNTFASDDFGFMYADSNGKYITLTITVTYSGSTCNLTFTLLCEDTNSNALINEIDGYTFSLS